MRRKSNLGYTTVWFGYKVGEHWYSYRDPEIPLYMKVLSYPVFWANDKISRTTTAFGHWRTQRFKWVKISDDNQWKDSDHMMELAIAAVCKHYLYYELGHISTYPEDEHFYVKDDGTKEPAFHRRFQDAFCR